MPEVESFHESAQHCFELAESSDFLEEDVALRIRAMPRLTEIDLRENAWSRRFQYRLDSAVGAGELPIAVNFAL